MNGYQQKVDTHRSHRFLIGLLEINCCNFDQLLSWIREHVTGPPLPLKWKPLHNQPDQKSLKCTDHTGRERW